MQYTLIYLVLINLLSLFGERERYIMWQYVSHRVIRKIWLGLDYLFWAGVVSEQAVKLLAKLQLDTHEKTDANYLGNVL